MLTITFKSYIINISSEEHKESEEMKMKREVIAIEKHLYENKDHTVRTEYQVYYEPRIYNIKTPSQLTKREKVAFKEIGKTIFHF